MWQAARRLARRLRNGVGGRGPEPATVEQVRSELGSLWKTGESHEAAPHNASQNRIERLIADALCRYGQELDAIRW